MRTGITDAGIEALRQALPNLQTVQYRTMDGDET
jgi:hypothetical protein